MTAGDQNIDSVLAGVAVADFEAAQSWYSKLFGREPDVVPTEGIAEWQLAPNAWVQLTENPDRAGKSSVVIGVRDLAAQVKSVESAGFTPGAVEEYPGIVKTSTIFDPEGNEVTFVEELTE
ncbi:MULTISPECIES: VOC family protein [unclassified Crossiella]|uniref:VOC family protein n=1 Tax=unclassified Crossiella TaxID=2620835 RepID=UPI001FFFED8D|nr:MULTISPECIES: VOC family protein [unclassified Crossiella]MCK2244580.1 VOC family protein [Crossiella sp. S99.2]MCK2258211.1 VOC family protein [Crossiella sp. S99.1]